MSTAALSAANRTAVTAMVLLMLVTLVVVFAGAYILSRRLMVPIELVRRALWKITQGHFDRSEEHTSELQSLMRISYAVFCLKKQNHTTYNTSRSKSLAPTIKTVTTYIIHIHGQETYQ